MFRLLGLLGGLSIATDLGTGAPQEESLTRGIVAARIARAVGCSDDDVRDVLYVALLQHLGCTAPAPDLARILGDDVIATRLAFVAGSTRTADVFRTVVPGVAAATGRRRARVAGAMLLHGRTLDTAAPAATCEVARGAARRLGLGKAVQDGLSYVPSSWDGTGYPRAAGTEIPLAARIMHVASTAVMFALSAGVDAAIRQVERRSGGLLDPTLASALTTDMISDVGDLDPYEAILDVEPDPVRRVGDAELDSIARTFGDLVDLKSPWLVGHSSAVAALATAAAQQLGGVDSGRVRIAGHLHDIGRVGVSSRIWSKPGPLTTTERDQARLHPYYTERVLARVPALAGSAEAASQHHERLDGSGYHRGLSAAALSLSARVVGAADCYRDQVEARPHRPAASADDAAARLRHEVTAGRLDGEAVAAVLRAAGVRGGRRPRPAGLTERQCEVLRLLARGRSNAQIGDALHISRRTAERHVQDIYTGIGVSTRAAAALFAMEHGLVGPPPSDQSG